MIDNKTPEINLTLDPFGSAAAAAPAPASAAPEAPAQSAPALDESAFSESERKMINDFSEKIDITDSTTVLGFGASAQKKISDFSDTALNGVRNKDFGETGEMITSLIAQLREMNDDAEDEGGFLGLFKSTRRKIENLKTKYDKVETSVNDITEKLQQHQITLLKDVAMFDNLYEVNMTYFKELSMYILAGKKKLQQEKDVTLKALQDKAKATGLPEDAQAANDFAEQCVRFERKIHDLELTRMVAVQMAPQIRLVQNNDTMMAEKIQTVIMNTIPLWKSQMVIALGIEHSRQAMEAQRAVTDMTNELLKKNAAALHQATVDVTRESERGVVDIETLTQTNTELIATLDDVAAIQAEGRDKRQAAEAELVRIENELKAKLIGMAQ